MSKEELIEKLKLCAKNGDIEGRHMKADKLLLQYINDKEITKVYNSFDKWHA